MKIDAYFGSENEVISWILENCELREVDSSEFIYDRMTSQSGECLPILYQRFDCNNRDHFRDRGFINDFSIVAGSGTVLDVGPGDGWPSLLIAPFTEKVIGIESSLMRVKVCEENALKLGIKNAEFVYVQPGETLPFTDNSFDGVMAASSVEQSPDVRGLLAEIFRILKPGGKLRMYNETLERYRGRELELWVHENTDSKTDLIIYERFIDDEFIRQFRLTLNLEASEFERLLHDKGLTACFASLSTEIMNEMKEVITESAVMITTHPSHGSLLKILRDVGFAQARSTISGGHFAGKLFDVIDVSQFQSLDDVDGYLRPLIQTVVDFESIDDKGLITAIK